MKVTSVAQAVESFVKARKADGRAPRTIKDYDRVLGPFAEWCLRREIALQSLDRDGVREYVGELHQRNWADNTLSIHVRVLRTFLRWLYLEDLVAENLAACIKPPRCLPRVEEPLTVEEVQALVDTCNGDRFAARDRALIFVFADTGLRLGEIFRLRRKDVCFSENGSAHLLVYATKTKTHRFVFLSPISASALREYLDKTGDADADEALWVGRFGPLTIRGIQGILNRRARRAGIEPGRIHPHAFRKFFATSWIRNGGDTVRLQRIGGWASPKMLEVYVLLAKTQDLEEAHRQFSPLSQVAS